MQEIQTVTYIDIANQGYPEGTARRVIREGKKLLVERGFKLYKKQKGLEEYQRLLPKKF